jgi:hypothetical protein
MGDANPFSGAEQHPTAMKIIDQIKRNAIPVELLRSAAKGALPLPAVEMLEILVYLATQSAFAEQAKITLAGWDLLSAVEVAADPGAPPDVLGYFWLETNRRPALLPALIENPAISEMLLLEAAAGGRREIVAALLSSPRARSSPMVVQALSTNPELTPEQLSELQGELLTSSPKYADHDTEAEAAYHIWHDAHATEIAAAEGKPFELIGEDEDETQAGEQTDQRAGEPDSARVESSTTLAVAGLGAVAKRKPLPADEKKLSVLQKIAHMDPAERVKAAFNGSHEERTILIRDGASVVRSAVLASPKLTEPEVELFAAAKNLTESVLREIARTRRFIKNYHVVRNLVNNPKCPLDISLTLVKNLLVYDLKSLRFNKGVPDTIRQVAGQLYREKTGPAREAKRR